MAKDYFSCAEVARLVRAALKESFPEIKFSVRSNTYSMGASITVMWDDGPSEHQVESVTAVFSGSRFDGMDDLKTSVKHVVDGAVVRFAADSIHVSRHYSDTLVQRAIDNVYHALRDSFDLHQLDKPTVQQYKNGETWQHLLVVPLDSQKVSLQELLNKELHALSEVAEIKPSATLARIKLVEKNEGSGHA